MGDTVQLTADLTFRRGITPDVSAFDIEITVSFVCSLSIT